jgi:hypothetical protein
VLVTPSILRNLECHEDEIKEINGNGNCEIKFWKQGIPKKNQQITALFLKKPHVDYMYMA